MRVAAATASVVLAQALVLVAPTATATETPVVTAAAPISGAVVVAGGGASVGYTTPVVAVTKGSSLSLINLDGISHTVTSVARDARGRPLFNGNALPGRTVSVDGVEKLPPGSYPFFCQFHPNMTGTLVVLGSGGGKPAGAKQSFRLPLRIPPVVTSADVTLKVQQTDVRVLPSGPATRMWTYAGSYPGPTIRRPAGALTKVTLVNRLPAALGELTLHFHGDHHASADDGQPDSHLVPPGGERTYTYPLRDHGRPERAAFDFYHDHRMDVTGRNVWNGLQGMFIVDDPVDARLPLPKGGYDVPLLVSDRSFTPSNQLTEPFPFEGDGSDTLQNSYTGQYAPPGDATVGDHVLVNGVFAPHFDVATHRYRLRILNGSGFQSYEFHLTDNRPFVQVGTDSGLLPAPVVRQSILLGPAERADVVVDFTGEYGKSVVLESVARSDHRPGGIGTPTVPIMQFRVTKKVRDTTRVPTKLRPVPPLAVPLAPSVTWTFGLGADATGTYWTVNGRHYDPTRADATVPLGSVQRWRLVNLSPITHYIHIHEEQWRTVTRDGQPPPPWEAGLKDTWRLDPGETVEVAAKMTDYTGLFMIHCHMLDHEDHGMMAQFKVVKGGTTTALPPLPSTAADAGAAALAGLPLTAWTCGSAHDAPAARPEEETP